jgi:hypothetical protein
VLFTGSGDEVCGLLPALLQAEAYHPPAVGLPAFPAICLLIVHGDQFLVPPCFSGVLSVTQSLCCVLVFSLLVIIQVSIFFEGGQSA